MADNTGDSVATLAAAPIDDDDVVLLRRVAEVWDAVDPVPEGLVERLQFDITLDALHAEIAQLERLDDLVGVRGEDTAETQTITFTSRDLTTMVTVTPTGAERVRVDGWIAPGGGVEVELRAVDGSQHTRADADGRFVFEDVPTGLVKFVLRRPDGSPPVLTPAIAL